METRAVVGCPSIGAGGTYCSSISSDPLSYHGQTIMRPTKTIMFFTLLYRGVIYKITGKWLVNIQNFNFKGKWFEYVRGRQGA